MDEMTDKEREDAIDRHLYLLGAVTTPAARRKEWNAMQRLIRGRSRRQQDQIALDRQLPPLNDHSNND